MTQAAARARSMSSSPLDLAQVRAAHRASCCSGQGPCRTVCELRESGLQDRWAGAAARKPLFGGFVACRCC